MTQQQNNNTNTMKNQISLTWTQTNSHTLQTSVDVGEEVTFTAEICKNKMDENEYYYILMVGERDNTRGGLNETNLISIWSDNEDELRETAQRIINKKISELNQ